jgi:soluble lytic murein transglycosylase-like protein
MRSPSLIDRFHSACGAARRGGRAEMRGRELLRATLFLALGMPAVAAGVAAYAADLPLVPAGSAGIARMADSPARAGEPATAAPATTSTTATTPASVTSATTVATATIATTATVGDSFSTLLQAATSPAGAAPAPAPAPAAGPSGTPLAADGTPQTVVPELVTAVAAGVAPAPEPAGPAEPATPAMTATAATSAPSPTAPPAAVVATPAAPPPPAPMPPVGFDAALGVPRNRYGKLIYQTSLRYALNPLLVAAIMKAESDFNPRARSRKGALGLMQMLPSTARRFGLQRRKDLFNPKKNIETAGKYLRWLVNRFGEDPLRVLAAYNAGEGNVERFGGVPPFAETRDYVQRIFADLGFTAVLLDLPVVAAAAASDTGIAGSQ